MRLAKIRIRGLRSIIAYERDLKDEWFGEVSPTLLVLGINGVGKTTLLDAIATLWDDFGHLLQAKEIPKRIKTGMFKTCRLVAFQFQQMTHADEPPTWLFVASLDQYEEFQSSLAGCQYLGIVKDTASEWRIVTHDLAWRADLAEKRDQSLVGRINLPNIVYITSDDRALIEPKDAGKVKPFDPEMNWLAVYKAKEHDVSSLMYRLKAEDPGKYAAVLRDINEFLVEKKIDGFQDDGKLRVRTVSGAVHSVYQLSTGERQIVLLTAFISRWLRPGGLLLVDEPDLHLHVSATQAMVDALQALVEDRDGQLLFTSHNPEVWEDFARPSERIELKISTLANTENTPGDVEPSAATDEEDNL